MRALPNVITLFRLASAPVIVWLLARGNYGAALGLVLLAGASDWLDGYTARRLGVQGASGVVLDPLADKILLVTLFVALAVLGLLPMWMLWLALGRDLVIVCGALALRTLRRVRKFLPSVLGKVSTFFQIVLVLLALAEAAMPGELLRWLKLTALGLSALFTALSGLDYVRIGIQMERATAGIKNLD